MNTNTRLTVVEVAELFSEVIIPSSVVRWMTLGMEYSPGEGCPDKRVKLASTRINGVFYTTTEDVTAFVKRCMRSLTRNFSESRLYNVYNALADYLNEYCDGDKGVPLRRLPSLYGAKHPRLYDTQTALSGRRRMSYEV